jgi:hypothetical protein
LTAGIDGGLAVQIEIHPILLPENVTYFMLLGSPLRIQGHTPPSQSDISESVAIENGNLVRQIYNPFLMIYSLCANQIWKMDFMLAKIDEMFDRFGWLTKRYTITIPKLFLDEAYRSGILVFSDKPAFEDAAADILRKVAFVPAPDFKTVTVTDDAIGTTLHKTIEKTFTPASTALSSITKEEKSILEYVKHCKEDIGNTDITALKHSYADLAATPKKIAKHLGVDEPFALKLIRILHREKLLVAQNSGYTEEDKNSYFRFIIGEEGRLLLKD